MSPSISPSSSRASPTVVLSVLTRNLVSVPSTSVTVKWKEVAPSPTTVTSEGSVASVEGSVASVEGSVASVEGSVAGVAGDSVGWVVAGVLPAGAEVSLQPVAKSAMAAISTMQRKNDSIFWVLFFIFICSL